MVSVRPLSNERIWEVAKQSLELHEAIASCDSYTSLVLSNLPRAP